jgi:hypothetical protein
MEREQAIIGAEVTRLASEMEQLAVGTERLARRVHELTTEAERLGAYAESMNAVLGTTLLRDLPPNTRICRQPAGPCSRVICSLATGEGYRSLLGRSALSFERYAERWGWDLVLSTETLAGDRPAPWGKVPLIRSLLDDYEWVLWLDADVVVTDLDADISGLVRDDKDLYLVEHAWLGQYTANSGVMLLRSNDWSRSFIDEVWARADDRDRPWWDNAPVLELLGYSLEPARLVQPTPWLQRTQLIDKRWNSIELEPAERPAFVHRGFYDVRTRIRQVTEDLQCLLGGADPMTAGRERPTRRISAVTDVHRREELPLLLTARGLTGIGAVVGVGNGHFCEWILDTWVGEKLFCIDPWPNETPGAGPDTTRSARTWERAETWRRLARFGARAEPWHTAAADAAPYFSPECLDYVYLDAVYDATSAREELERWWPRLRPGGIIAGSDKPQSSVRVADRSVLRGINAFFQPLKVEVHLTEDDLPRPGWIARKPSG